MVNEKLVAWTRSKIKAGYEKQDIVDFLIKKNYTKEEVHEVFNNIENNKEIKKEKVEKKEHVEVSEFNGFDFWDKLKYLFSNPNLFFEKIKHEKGMKNSFFMLLIIALFIVIFGIGMIFTTRFGRYGTIPIFSYFNFLGYVPIIVAILLFIVSPLYVGIIHAIVVAFKGSGKYAETYKAYAYSIMPAILLSLIPFAGLASIIYSYILMTIGISKLHNIGKGKAVLAILMPVILIAGLIVIFVIMARNLL